MQSSRTVIVVFVLAAAGAGFLLWRAKRPSTAPVPAPAPIARPATPPVVPSPPPPPAKPAIEHPLAEEAPGPALPELNASDSFFKKALGDLVGNKSVTSFFMLDGFARRVVATVNNLDTDTAAADLWPVIRTPGRIEVKAAPAGDTIASSNANRYGPFVRFVAELDTRRAVALYRRAYPLLQRAYADLGASGYFNDRVVKVIEHLLATPETAGPILVRRAGGDGGSGAGLFLFADPTLEARSTGQKMLLRMGPENAAKLKEKLADIRRLIARAP